MQTRQELKTALETLRVLSSQELYQVIKQLPSDVLDRISSLSEMELIERDSEYLSQHDGSDEGNTSEGTEL